MRLAVTGGGTGGHVFPALEVALRARDRGHDVWYLGSLRGQERLICQKAGLSFEGFPSEPVYSLKHPAGWKALMQLFRASILAKRSMRKRPPNVILSTGGYASVPIVRAAGRSYPYVIHEQNAVPGRANRLASKRAFAVATTFHRAANAFDGAKVVRTGLPIRSELRQAALGPTLLDAEPRWVFAVGGSQGAAALNEAVLATAQRMTRPLRWLHVTGKKHFESTFPTYEKLGLTGSYQLRAYLDGPEMAEAYRMASVVVGRSGAGTLSELAAFGLPSVLIPYPHAYANHQDENAREFEELGAAVRIPQAELHPARLEEVLDRWFDVDSARESAREALAAWDVPDAVDRILSLLESAAGELVR